MRNSRSPSQANDEVSLDGQQARKKRKARPQLSCTECRRLKLKCDRQIPCSTCIRRECADKCHAKEIAEPELSGADLEVARLQERLSSLEQFIHRANISETSQSSNNSAGVGVGVGAMNPPTKRNQDTAPGDRKRPRHTSSPSHTTTTRDAQPVTHAIAGHSPFPSSEHSFGSAQNNLEYQFHPPAPPTPVSAIRPFDYTTGQTPVFTNEPYVSQTAYIARQPVASTSSFQGFQGIPNVGGTGQPPDTGLAGKTADNTDEQGHGTLVISRSGRSKYLGRTAAAEWLKNQEMVESGESPPPTSRMPSPGLSYDQSHQMSHMGMDTGTGMGMTTSLGATVAFPFNTASRLISTSAILAVLPPRSEGRLLIDTYFRHFSWHFNIASKSLIDSISDKAYSGSRSSETQQYDVSAQQLALLFVVFAVGSYYNLELSPDDPSVEDYLGVSKACLAKGDFLANNTTAGVQTLHIMAHLLLSMDSGKNGDSAWPLWGLTAHMSLAMGLHRDGARWNLPDHAVEERRRVFWECHSTEIMSCNCFSRPGIINPNHVDTAYPRIVPGDIEVFHRAKYELSHVFAAVLDHSSQVKTPPYSECLALYQRACEFERNVPYELRSRPVLCALPSAYPAPESAIAASPPIDKRNLHLTFQQFTIAMNISELIVFLMRPYFAQALHECPEDPTRSTYGQSYLAVVERCNAIAIIATNAYSLYPHAAARHWWIWYHAFSSAICMGSLILKNPQNVLAGLALTIIDNVVDVYQQVVGSRNSPRMVKNLNWLRRLQQKLKGRLTQSPYKTATSATAATTATAAETANSDDDDAELLGWRTRLISRQGQGLQVSRTIRADSTSTTSPYQHELSDYSPLNHAHGASGVLHGGAEQLPPPLSGNAWETEFNQFWESMVQTDGLNAAADPGAFNWWGLDALAEGEAGAGQGNVTRPA
ncbi:uncharacterized protein I303_102619 [Kwoniella dejecticola CBS 10117]|uniref:Zn(2)-C6 fungal-type domain-containing protein n=1 Tax=Kwoniella dejecticola CBS 10117 TaxID=1296121 RepID=A0AAJ8KM24_9TREE